MIYRTLGRTGLKVSAISLGCEGFIGKSAAETKELMDFAMANGVNMMDMYSSNPDLRTNVGLALQERRKNFILQGHLCTIWENGQYERTRDLEKTKAAFQEQLSLLNTSYLDIGMIHYVDSEEDFLQVFNDGIIQFAQELKQKGLIRFIGVSSHNPTIARKMVETGIIDVLLFSINPCYDLQPSSVGIMALFEESTYKVPQHNIDKEREALYELCERTNVGIDVMKAFGGGDLLSEENSPFGKALTAVQCLEYALTRPAVAAVMCGCHSIEELQTNLHWCDADAAEKDYASTIAGLDKFTWEGHCMYCGHCAPCSASINIAYVNKYYNLTVAQHEEIPETVREHYKALEHHASECLQCGDCEARCPFGVKIREQMLKAAERFGY